MPPTDDAPPLHPMGDAALVAAQREAAPEIAQELAPSDGAESAEELP